MDSGPPLPNPRRRVLIACGSALVAPIASGCATGGAGRDELDLSTSAARLRAFVRMRGAVDDRLVIGCLSGRYHGVVDGDPTPLFGLAAATFARFRAMPGGGYEFASHEQAFFTDLETGRPLDEWTNPYNGRRVKPPVTQSPVSWRVLTSELAFRGRDPDPPGVSLEQRVLVPVLQGRHAVFTEQARFSGRRPGAPRPFHYAETVALRARLDDLADPTSARVPTVTAYTAISSWRPWMEMDDARGEMVASGIGGYGVGIDEMPRAWREAVKVARPELLDDPGASIAAAWNR